MLLLPLVEHGLEQVLYDTVLWSSGGAGTESVPRREEGSTGKYQHEVEGVPEGAARGNSQAIAIPKPRAKKETD